MNAPITSLIQKSTKGGMKVQQPLLNVGGKSCGCTSNCGCGSPAKYLGGVFGDQKHSKEQMAEYHAKKKLKKAVKGETGLFGSVLNAFSPSLGATYKASKIAKASKEYKEARKGFEDWRAKTHPSVSDTPSAPPKKKGCKKKY